MTRTTELLKEIHDELERGITRNKVLPLDWAMDRIEPIIEKALSKVRLDALKEEVEFLENLIREYEQLEWEGKGVKIRNRLRSIQEEIKLIEGKI